MANGPSPARAPALVAITSSDACRAAQQAAEKPLGFAAAVDVRGVDEGSAGFAEGRELGLCNVFVAVAAPAHRAQAEARHDQSALSQAPLFHDR